MRNQTFSREIHSLTSTIEHMQQAILAGMRNRFNQEIRPTGLENSFHFEVTNNSRRDGTGYKYSTTFSATNRPASPEQPDMPPITGPEADTPEDAMFAFLYRVAEYGLQFS
jgi:hypothetical protein